MIVLKILLWILLAILGIILLILLLPVRAEGSFIDGKLVYKLKYSCILLYDSDKRGLLAWYLKRKKQKKQKTDTQEISDDDGDIGDIPDDILDDIPDDVPEYPQNTTDNAVSEPEKTSDAPETENVTSEETPADETPAEEEVPEEDNKKKKKEKKKRTKKAKKEDERIDSKMNLIEKIDFVLDIWRAANRPILKILKSVKLHEVYIDFIIANDDAYKCALNYGRISGTVYNLLAWLSVLFNVKFKTVDINPGFALKSKESRWDISAKLCVRPMTAVITGVCLLITYLIRYFLPLKLQQRRLKKSAARRK